MSLALSCGVAEKVENKIDCTQVCNRYKDCVDSDYDVDSCVDSCESETNADEDQEQRLEECQVCIDERSCGEAVFNCTADCAGIIN
jgi:hypothetical protein